MVVAVVMAVVTAVALWSWRVVCCAVCLVMVVVGGVGSGDGGVS